ncbi:MAG: hypothetical protein JOY90_17675 [Bradyrhizobium sp.]|nr:hypothetical protein [Bradyrhizobium sp.]
MIIEPRIAEVVSSRFTRPIAVTLRCAPARRQGSVDGVCDIGKGHSPPAVSAPLNVKRVTHHWRDKRYRSAGWAPRGAKAETMSTRRMAYWWFRFVISGRFLATFLDVQPAAGRGDLKRR